MGVAKRKVKKVSKPRKLYFVDYGGEACSYGSIAEAKKYTRADLTLDGGSVVLYEGKPILRLKYEIEEEKL